MGATAKTEPLVAPGRPRLSGLATLFPGYFALVMATGIVSIGAHIHGLEVVAQSLFWLNVLFYAVLWGLTGLRLLRFRQQLLQDLVSPTRGAGFLTKVAGTCVLGSQVAILTPWLKAAEFFWWLGLALWVGLIYTFFTAVIVRENKPTLEAGISGGWLVAVVSTESICVLGAQLSPRLAAPDLVLLISLVTYFIGAMLYLLLITLILYRWAFFTLKAEQLMPPYWINMGALAITTLAGTRLLLAAEKWRLLRDLSPFLTGFTFFFWAAGSWWIPLLVILGAWRHLRERVPLTYDPQYWSLVFPLGMYTVATWMLGKVTRVVLLQDLSWGFLFVALVAWSITFVGMLRQFLPSRHQKAAG